MKEPSKPAEPVRFDTGALLRQVRGKMSQEAFAELLGVGRTTVIRYESNERAPDAEFLLRLNMLYGLDPLHVLTGMRAETALLGNEKELIQNYRAADESGKKLIEGTASLAAQPKAAKQTAQPSVSVGTVHGQQIIGDQTNHGPLTFGVSPPKPKKSSK